MTLPSFDAVWMPEQPTTARLITVTGEIGTGKTIWCSRLSAYVRARGGTVAGLLSPAVYADSGKIGIDLIALGSGARRRLANRRTVPDNTSPTPNWEFDDEVLAWGDSTLAAIGAVDLLIIDELGPLELLHGAGWASALPLLDRRAYHLACVVVRRRLLDAFLERFPDAGVIAFD